MRILFILSALLTFPNLAAACPEVPPFLHRINVSAEEYATRGRLSLNENGVLVHDYGADYGGLGKWPNPFFVSRYANALYADWHDGGCKDSSIKAEFLAQADWLASSAEERDGMAVWVYPFDNHYFDVPAGWYSGIGQSHIAAVLYRAFLLTEDERYRDLSESAMLPYLRSMSDGGVVTYADGGMWIQEVPSQNNQSFNILNGHITGIMGVLDMATIAGHDEYIRIVDMGIDVVQNRIEDFDAGFTSFYSLDAPHGERVRLAPLDGYHNLHIWQLEELYELDDRPLFARMARRFQRYQDASYERSAMGFTAETHTADGADGRGAGLYWSHNVFPTWYDVDLNGDKVLKGIYIQGRTPSNSPRELSISLTYHSETIEIWSAQQNKEQYLYLAFSDPILASSFRVDIQSDNGANNVALDYVMPILDLDSDASAIKVLSSSDTVTVHATELTPGLFRRE